MRVGFIGIGNQGAPMAARIVAGGFPLTVYARRPETLAEFDASGYEVATTPAELARTVDVLCTCVRTDADVEALCFGDDGVIAHLSAGSTLVVHSTVHPDTVRKVASEAASRGVDVLDAPVSGGAPVAAAGGLLTMVGGDNDVLERCRPVLATHSSTIIHLGDVGSGQLAKIVNNALFGAHIALGYGALDLAGRLGLDPQSMLEVLRNGSGGSFAMNVAGASASHPEGRERMISLINKDLGLILAVAGDDEAAQAIVASTRRVFDAD